MNDVVCESVKKLSIQLYALIAAPGEKRKADKFFDGNLIRITSVLSQLIGFSKNEENLSKSLSGHFSGLKFNESQKSVTRVKYLMSAVAYILSTQSDSVDKVMEAVQKLDESHNSTLMPIMSLLLHSNPDDVDIDKALTEMILKGVPETELNESIGASTTLEEVLKSPNRRQPQQKDDGLRDWEVEKELILDEKEGLIEEMKKREGEFNRQRSDYVTRLGNAEAALEAYKAKLKDHEGTEARLKEANSRVKEACDEVKTLKSQLDKERKEFSRCEERNSELEAKAAAHKRVEHELRRERDECRMLRVKLESSEEQLRIVTKAANDLADTKQSERDEQLKPVDVVDDVVVEDEAAAPESLGVFHEARLNELRERLNLMSETWVPPEVHQADLDMIARLESDLQTATSNSRHLLGDLEGQYSSRMNRLTQDLEDAAQKLTHAQSRVQVLEHHTKEFNEFYERRKAKWANEQTRLNAEIATLSQQLSRQVAIANEQQAKISMLIDSRTIAAATTRRTPAVSEWRRSRNAGNPVEMRMFEVQQEEDWTGHSAESLVQAQAKLDRITELAKYNAKCRPHLRSVYALEEGISPAKEQMLRTGDVSKLNGVASANKQGVGSSMKNMIKRLAHHPTNQDRM